MLQAVVTCSGLATRALKVVVAVALAPPQQINSSSNYCNNKGCMQPVRDLLVQAKVPWGPPGLNQLVLPNIREDEK